MTLLRLLARQHRAGLLAVAGFGAFSAFVQGAAFPAVAGHTEATRQAFGAQMTLFAGQISYLLPVPHHPETLAGYIQWRGFGSIPLILAFWCVLSVAGAGRGDEERGLTEQWLAGAVSRRTLVAARSAAFAIATLLFGAAAMTGGAAGAAVAGGTLPAPGLFAGAVNAAALGWCLFGLGLVCAQFTSTRRSTAATAGILVAALFFVNSLSRASAPLRPWSRLSPFNDYDRSLPIAPGGSVDWLSIAVLMIAAVALTALAAGLFSVRDLGAPLVSLRGRNTPPTTAPAANPFLRRPVLSALYEERIGLISWLLVTAALCAFIASITESTATLIERTPGLSGYVHTAGGGALIKVSLLGLATFGIVQALVAVFSVTRVARWAADDADGRLEMVLAAPVARTGVVLERAAVLLVELLLLVLVATLTVAALAPSQHLSLTSHQLLDASLPLIVLGLAFGAVGGALNGRVPRQAAPVLGGYAGLAYLIQQFGPLGNIPTWFQKLSVFNLYGNPLASGIDQQGLLLVATAAAAGFAASLYFMQRREVGR
ncbi:MAG: hypothetical protein NVS9B1_18900 [Candidatus Dormibacteraceae bacterium]